jgi:hypothetical protein
MGALEELGVLQELCGESLKELLLGEQIEGFLWIA